MRLLLLGMNYAPEVTGIAPFSTGLAEHLVARNHDVVVATTFPHYPQWVVQAPYRGRLRVVEQRGGVQVRRTPIALPRPGSALSRIWYDSSLALGALLNSLPVRRADLVLCVSPPIQLGLTAALLARFWKAPLALLIKDLPLEAAVAVGLLPQGRVYRAGRWLERLVYGRTDRVIVISRGFKQSLLRQGVLPEKIVEIPDWANTDTLRPMQPDADVRASLGAAAGDFLVLHTGNMGEKQGLGNAVMAARPTDGGVRLKLTLVGDGSDRGRLESMVSEQKLSNVRLLPLQSAERFPFLLAAADALLLHQRANVLDSVAPSKLLTYMAAGRPVLAAVHPKSEAATVIEAAGCGLLVPPDDPPALARAAQELAADQGERARLAANGRRHVEEHYARDRILARYEECLSGLLEKRVLPEMQPPRAPEAGLARRGVWQLALKRGLDVLVSAASLVALSPVLAAIAVAIKAGDGGAALYPWKVVGQGGRPFTGYKFRTMVPNADVLKAQLMASNEMTGPVFKMRRDPRVTPIGWFLRRYSLDELPQLWSVLKGDMSLVGPRPPLETEYAQFTDWQKQKLAVKPGITCLWQISGRNDIPDFDEWVRLDLEYIRGWSLWLDLKILLLTVPAVLRARGAA